MKKALISSILAATLAIVLIAGCAAPAPAPAPKSSPSPAASPAQVQPIELKMNVTVPGESVNGRNFKAWADTANQRTGGKVDIKFYAASSLLKIPEIFRGVRSGIADISVYFPGIEEGLLSLNSYIDLHFLQWPSFRAASRIIYELYNTIPALAKEYEDVGLKMYKANAFPGYSLHMAKKVVKTPGDVKGEKILTSGGPLAFGINASGGAPLDLPISEFYTSLDKGLATGLVQQPGTLIAFKLMNLLPYHTFFGDAGVCTRSNVFIFNLNSWKKLPPDVQKVLNDMEAEWVEKIAQGYEAEVNMFMDEAKKQNHTMTYLTPQEIKAWSDLYTKEHEEWMAKNEAVGKPARAVYAELQKLIEKYKGMK